MLTPDYVLALKCTRRRAVGKNPLKAQRGRRISEEHKRITAALLAASAVLPTVSYLNSQPSPMLSTTATLIRSTRLIRGVRLLHTSPLVKMPIQVKFMCV